MVIFRNIMSPFSPGCGSPIKPLPTITLLDLGDLRGTGISNKTLRPKMGVGVRNKGRFWPCKLKFVFMRVPTPYFVPESSSIAVEWEIRSSCDSRFKEEKQFSKHDPRRLLQLRQPLAHQSSTERPKVNSHR